MRLARPSALVPASRPASATHAQVCKYGHSPSVSDPMPAEPPIHAYECTPCASKSTHGCCSPCPSSISPHPNHVAHVSVMPLTSQVRPGPCTHIPFTPSMLHLDA